MSRHRAHYLTAKTAPASYERIYYTTCDCGWFSAESNHHGLPVRAYSEHVKSKQKANPVKEVIKAGRKWTKTLSEESKIAAMQRWDLRDWEVVLGKAGSTIIPTMDLIQKVRKELRKKGRHAKEN